jgi:hypothetical protein
MIAVTEGGLAHLAQSTDTNLVLDVMTEIEMTAGVCRLRRPTLIDTSPVTTMGQEDPRRILLPIPRNSLTKLAFRTLESGGE